MTPLQAMKQALEALVWVDNCPSNLDRVRPAITALLAAIAEMEKAEPVAGMHTSGQLARWHKHWEGRPAYAEWQPLYTHPAIEPTCKHQFVTTFGGDYCIKCNEPAPSNEHPEPAPQQQKPQTTIGDPADPAKPAAVGAARIFGIIPVEESDDEFARQVAEFDNAAPLPDEVVRMVERLRASCENGIQPDDTYAAADMIERLAWRVQDASDDLTVAYMDGAAKAVPPDCVVVKRTVTEKGKYVLLATSENYRTYQDQWTALIAAGEVKP